MSSSVISSTSPPVDGEKDDRRSQSPRIVCTAHGCNQTFSNANELAIHKQKHQMTLKLGPLRTGLADMLPFDQTPTPTKFLQYGKETGLFDEISNPFDSEFKRNTSGQSLKEKARRSAVPGLIINNNNKARTPTSYPSSTQPGVAPIAQPVHVITLTPTLPSPVIPGSQFFIPPLPSPQGFLPSPAALISPSIVPFSAPGLPFPTVQAVVEAQHAALTQAFISAAAAANPNQTTHLHGEVSSTTSQGHMIAPRTSSITDLPNTATPPFPTQNVSVPVNNNPTPPSCHSVGQNMASAPVGSASVIQQHGQANMEQQRRPLTQSNSLDHPSHAIPTIMERKPSFHSETSVITQAPTNSSTASQMNPNMNLHSFQYMQNSVPPFSQLAADVAGRLSSHPALTASRSVPTTISHNNIQNRPPPLPHQNSVPNIDAKQKLKETLTSNNPSLHAEIPNFQQQFAMKEEEKSMNEVTSSSGNEPKTGRRRGRQAEVDPDKKRMRFLERNRAAASRCRAKKKQWVSGLEVKAKELSSSNIGLQNEVASLREEVASLKQLLLAHRDCPITRLQQQKLAIAGGDPAAVVSDPVQAAASLLGISKEENGDSSGLLMSKKEDIKSNQGSHDFATSVSDANMQMQTSVVVNANHACKTEQPTEGFPSVLPQTTNASAIVMNNNYNATLSTASST